MMSGSEVIEPWPISAPAVRMVMAPLGAMRTQGVIFRALSVTAAAEVSRRPLALMAT